jgi:3',5'-cyclic AMP phosphodiesterase CpdA
MRTLVHLSDLHFGRTDDALLEPLAAIVREIAPDLIAVSGDLTQRARAVEFKAARAFLDRLPKPLITVPGNHDIPLYNVFKRFLRPRTFLSRRRDCGARYEYGTLADLQTRPHQRDSDRERAEAALRGTRAGYKDNGHPPSVRFAEWS